MPWSWKFVSTTIVPRKAMKSDDQANIRSEYPFYIPNGGRKLFGILHRAVSPANGRGVVICYPFAEERLWAHRVMVTFARILAKDGYAVLRFDYMGNGDSEGNFEDSNVETSISDIIRSIEWIKEGVHGIREVDLLGLRIGATFAALVAMQVDTVSRLILWGPIPKGNSYMQELLRSNLLHQMATYDRVLFDRKRLVQMLLEGKTVNIDGYDVTRNMYEQISGIDLEKPGGILSCPCLIVQIDDRPKEISSSYQRISAQWGNTTLVSVVEDPFWREIPKLYCAAPNLYSETRKWMDAP